MLGSELSSRSRRQRRVLALRERRAQRKNNRALARGLAVGAVLAGAGPAAAATFTVINTNDSGPGSLRQALIDANAAAGADDIAFTVVPPATISLLTALPQITSPLTITGLGASNLTIRRDGGGAAFRIFDIAASAAPEVTITGVTLTNGNSPTGGAIRAQGPTALAVTVADAVISGNSAGQGGGIAAVTGTSLTVRRTLIDGNTANGQGGGLYLPNVASLVLEDSTVSGNVSGDAGGGLYCNVPGGPVTIRGTTISGNTSAGGAFGGGGLSFVTYYSPPIVIENATISGNATVSGGGGVSRAELLLPGGEGTGLSALTITHSTITLNTATGGFSAGGLWGAGFATTLRNTIVSGNTNAGAPDIFGSAKVNFCAVGSPLGWNPDAGSGNNLPFGTDLQLGPLQGNGGPTLTHEPGPNAPPVNAGDPAFVPPPDFDQRGPGFPRVVGAVIDIGAVERNPEPVELQDVRVE